MTDQGRVGQWPLAQAEGGPLFIAGESHESGKCVAGM